MVEYNVSNETSVFYSHDFLFYKLFIEKNWEAKIWRASLNEHLDKLSMTRCLVKTKYWLWQGRGGNKPLSDLKKKNSLPVWQVEEREETKDREIRRQQRLKSLRPCFWPCDDFGFYSVWDTKPWKVWTEEWCDTCIYFKYLYLKYL